MLSTSPRVFDSGGFVLRVVVVCISALQGVDANIPCHSKNMMQFSTLAPKDMPLCGNGVLDAGEVCDDGNREGGDGCNGWCSAFDRMTKACTLAGQNRECTRGTTLASSPSQSSFCRLSSVAIAPSGKYLVVADGKSLVRMDLFTDSVMENLFVLPASGSAEFGRFCSLFIFSGSYRRVVGGEDGGDKDDIIVAHDCEKQNIVVFIYDGSTYIIKTPLQLQSQNLNKSFMGYLDQEAKQLVVAGLPLAPDGLRCVDVYTVDLESYKVALLGSIECVAFNVVEAGKTYPSFSMDGMVPYRILREACPFLMTSPVCYAVYMERNDMQLAKAYISVDGGTDTEYVVSTDETLNVLGAPIVTRSEKSKITYTLTGNCFTAANTILSEMKRIPPVFALGYSCGTLPIGTGKCLTPLNNPFITDIVSSSYLLPSGLSATHEHQELLDIFTQGNAAAMLSNTTVAVGGLPLYRQILDNTHKGNVPIDFVELPQTQDVIYITETTIGMINSKGMMLMDLYNPGYCRAIDTILCPPGFFGAVGGICRACADEDSPSVSAQIQCTGLVSSKRRRRLLSVFQSAPYTQLSMVVSNKVRKNDIDTLMKFFLITHGYNCSDASAMTGYQPYNMAADLQDANQQAAPDGKKCTQLIPCIIESASAKMQRNLTLAVPEEYLISWTLQNSSLVNALTKIGVSKTKITTTDKLQAERCGLSADTVDRLERSGCMVWINSDFHKDWLPCALSVLNGSSADKGVLVSANGRRRHLLQTGSGDARGSAVIMLVVPQTQGTFMSGTSISWGVLSQTDPSPPSKNNNNNNKNGNNNGAEESNILIIVIVTGVVAGVLIAILIIGIFYMYFIRTRNAGMTSAQTRAFFPSSSYGHDTGASRGSAYFPLKSQ